MSQGSFWALNMDSKWFPNRIIDAEGVRKPLDKHLRGYQSALRGILGALGRILSAIRWLAAVRRANKTTKAARGGGEDKPLPGNWDKKVWIRRR